MNTRKRVLLTLGILALMATAVSAGTFALFTVTTAVPGELFSTGTLSMSASPASALATLSNMVPGDSITGLETLTNSGTEDITAYQLVTTVTAGTPTNPNVLTSDATNGLRVWVQRCPTAYSGSGVSSTCASGAVDVVGTSAAPVAIVNTFSLSSNAFCTTNGAVTAGVRTARGTTCDSNIPSGVDHLKVRVSLPTTADNTFEGLSTTLTFSFDGSQAAGASF